MLLLCAASLPLPPPWRALSADGPPVERSSNVSRWPHPPGGCQNVKFCLCCILQLLAILVRGTQHSFFNFVGLVLLLAPNKCFGDSYIDVRQKCLSLVLITQSRHCGFSRPAEEMQQLRGLRNTLERRLVETSLWTWTIAACCFSYMLF